MVGFSDLLETPYAPVSKIPSVKRPSFIIETIEYSGTTLHCTSIDGSSVAAAKTISHLASTI